MHTATHFVYDVSGSYGVATSSRLLKNIGLFSRISSLLYGSFAKETYVFREPTNRSHPTPYSESDCGCKSRVVVVG